MREFVGEGFRARIELHSGYLHAYVFGGEDSLAVSIAMWRLLIGQCRAYGMQRVLVVEDLAGTVPPSDFDALTRAQVELGLPDFRVAFVDLHSDVRNNELSELSLREQGVSAKVFTDEEEARRWLLYGME